MSKIFAVTTKVAAALPAAPPRDIWDRVLIASIFAGMLALAYAAFATTLLEPLFAIAGTNDWHHLWLRPTVIWVSMGMLLLLMRTLLWLGYRPLPVATPAEAPPLTVIIPAYNEGKMVEHAIAPSPPPTIPARGSRSSPSTMAARMTPGGMSSARRAASPASSPRYA